MSGLPKVNGAMLSRNQGKLVYLIGKVTQVSPSGNAVKILTSDQQTVTINLKDKYEDQPGCCILVIGNVQQNLSVIADKYVSFSGGDKEFDLTLYNKVLKVTQSYQELFTLPGGGSGGGGVGGADPMIDNMDDW